MLKIVIGLHRTYSINMYCMHVTHYHHSHFSGNSMLSLFYVAETINEVMIKKFANLIGSHHSSCFVIISHLFGTEDSPFSDVFSAFSQCQYVYLHQCVRDVLRARKLRSEQENPLFPIYENVNPEYHRGRILTNLQVHLSRYN